MASGKQTGAYELKSAKIIRGGEAVDITMMVSEMNIFSSIIDRTIMGEFLITDGRNVISTLNDTIYKTEAQIIYYDKLLNELQTICYDFSYIYDYTFLITQGSGGLLLSHFIMFAAFFKYYSIWNYEVKLVKLNNYYIVPYE